MSDFEVEISYLETAASNARDAAEEIGDIDLPGAVVGIAAAMPGSRFAVSAPALRTSWTAERDALADCLADCADGLEDSHVYRTTDDAAAAAFGGRLCHGLNPLRPRSCGREHVAGPSTGDPYAWCR